MARGVDLTFHGLSKTFGDHRALDGLTFTARAGRVTGLLGPNGAGKTTCLRTLVGLVSADAGRALVGGTPWARLTRPAAVVGVSLEGTGFHPWRTARAQLGLYARAVGASQSRVSELLEQVGLTAEAGRRIGGYSLGMRQRLSLAHALMAEPAALVLDEPTNGLDPAGVRWMRDVLRGEAARGTTVLVSSHMLAEMEHTVDDIVIVAEGRALVEESLDALRQRVVRRVELLTSEPERMLDVLVASGMTAHAQDHHVLVADTDTPTVLAVAGEHGVPVDDVRADAGSLEQAYFDVLATTGRRD